MYSVPKHLFLEKLIVTHLLRKLSAFYGTPKVQYRVHKIPLPVPVLNEMNPVNFPTCFSKIRFNIILLSTPTSSEWYPKK